LFNYITYAVSLPVPVSLTCTKIVGGVVFAPFQTGGAYSVPQSNKPPSGLRGSLQMKNVRNILVISWYDEDMMC